ncbi:MULTISPECIES: phage tail tape measure protein [unclassified Streptomyces]|uniref:phage tail tape measure protein n=1 Tax=unclassified Streptomyces TaxID=2593676 RepID=UPI001F19A904|nr:MULTISPECIES: phage tail tape measure protein [unclassified Streptomyces]MCF0086593.1 hypothetical protein [Streptomyces sp. MH192]MCF0098747.1 hypothetical protein [Streptomyces sp. MH191]
MANWNLSVDIRGHGNDLAQSLKSSAKHARTLGTAARTAKTEVRELGVAAQATGRHLRTLGRDAQTASRHLNTLGSRTQTAARRLTAYGNAAQNANRHLTSLGGHSRTASRDLARMSGQLNTAIRDLTRLAAAARTADARLNRVGGPSTAGLRRYRQEVSRVHSTLRSTAGMAAGLGLALGVHEVVEEGGKYQQAMNAFGATTEATQMQMRRAASTANQLGDDLKLPGATAADAAEGMLELAKAGFRTDQAISASRASVILASAAQVNAADSAKYLGDMMDQFGMGADQAGRAADTLAATANAASGDIIDIYYAMKYAGPVAHGMGVSMQEAASAVGMLGKAGILGQTAGTTLRGMLANMASPTKQMSEGLQDLGISAFDAQGNFKGLRYVIDGLSKAQHRMTQQDFAAAVKKSMGKPAMAGAIALAHQGTDSFDAMMQAVSRTGAASEIAAAKGKGLAGAMLQLKTQAKQTGLTIYQGMAPGLEFLTRGITAGLAAATPKIRDFFSYVNDAASLFGPDIAAAARDEFGGIADAVTDMASGFDDLGEDALAAFLHLLLSTGQMAIDVLRNLGEGVAPVVDALGDLSSEGGTVASTLDLVVTILDLATSAVSALSGVLGPIGAAVGGLVHAFSGLPGPVQQFVLAALLVRRINGPMNNLATTVSGRVTGAFRSLGQQMAVQRSLAAASGASISRYGAAFAVLQTRVPVIGRMGAAFRTASTQGAGLTGTLRGIGAASGVAARSMGSGLMGALGGPWGLAITAATVGLGFLATKQQEAAQAAAEHQARISSLSSALRESNGVVDESVRAIAAENLMQSKSKDWYGNQQRLVDLARKAKVPFSDLVDAYTGQGTSLEELQRRLGDVTKAHTRWTTDAESGAAMKAPDAVGKAAKALSDGLGGVSGDFKKAASDAKAYNEAVKGAGGGTTAYGRLKDAVAALADKTKDADSRTRALREALDLLSGGSVSLQAAQARVNEAISNANDSMADGINKSDGWGKSLLRANGQLDTTTKNGQALFNTFNTIADGASSAAIAAYDFAQSQGKDLPASLAASRGEMQKSRDAVVDLAQKYGLTKTQAQGVADSLGLIPGQVSILLQTEGVDSTLAELLAVQAQFEQFPDKKTVKVDALGEDAKKELEDLGYKIKLIPGTREYKITAPTQAARADLDKLIAKMSATPGSKTVKVDALTQAAIKDLQGVQNKVKATKGKTITVNAPTAAARSQLEALGFKIKSTKGKTVVISVPTGSQRANVAALASAISGLRNRTVTIRTIEVREHRAIYSTVGRPSKGEGGVSKYADGGVVHHAAHGLFVPGYAPRVDKVRALLSPGEGVLVPEAVRKLGAVSGLGRAGAIDALNQWGRYGRVRPGMGFDDAVTPGPDGYARFADGGVTDWRYDPSTGSLYSASDAGQAGHKTKKVKVKVKGKTTTKEVEYFDLGAVEKKLKSASKATTAWNNDLAKVADRVGGDVAEALAAMGEDGMKLAHKMATGSTKYINDMAGALRNLQKTAKASLTDYTRQLTNANKLNKTFSDNLTKLAAQGYGDLASQLAAQNDEAAQQLAASAVKDKSKASKANAAAKTANNALTADQVTELVQIIAGIKTSKTGIHDVAASTGLGEDEIITVAGKAASQIKSSLGSRSTRFLADLGKAQKGLAYADGGIRSGIYATAGGAVTFAEPSTGGEAYIPLGASKRSSATAVLADVAGRFGLGLRDASAGRTIIIRQDAPLIGESHYHIGDRRSDRDLARDIDARQGYQLRRLARGGVGAR